MKPRRSLEHARTCELLVSGHRLMEAALDVSKRRGELDALGMRCTMADPCPLCELDVFAKAYRDAENALVACRVAEPHWPPKRDDSHRCTCGKSFTTENGLGSHWAWMRRKGTRKGHGRK